MQFPSNFKNYVLIGLLLFYVIIMLLFYCAKMQEGFKEGADSSESTETSKTAQGSITLTTTQINTLTKSLNTLQTDFNDLQTQITSMISGSKTSSKTSSGSGSGSGSSSDK